MPPALRGQQVARKVHSAASNLVDGQTDSNCALEETAPTMGEADFLQEGEKGGQALLGKWEPTPWCLPQTGPWVPPITPDVSICVQAFPLGFVPAPISCLSNPPSSPSHPLHIHVTRSQHLAMPTAAHSKASEAGELEGDNERRDTPFRSLLELQAEPTRVPEDGGGGISAGHRRPGRLSTQDLHPSCPRWEEWNARGPPPTVRARPSP